MMIRLVRLYYRTVRLVVEACIAYSCFDLVQRLTHELWRSVSAAAVMLALGLATSSIPGHSNSYRNEWGRNATATVLVIFVEALSALFVREESTGIFRALGYQMSGAAEYTLTLAFLLAIEFAAKTLPPELHALSNPRLPEEKIRVEISLLVGTYRVRLSEQGFWVPVTKAEVRLEKKAELDL
jgi:hypothetical protein